MQHHARVLAVPRLRARSLISSSLVLGGLLAASISHADDSAASLNGVWAGRIGNDAVVVCFTHHGQDPGFGLYYDRSQPANVRLLTPDSKSSATQIGSPSSWSDGKNGWGLDPVNGGQVTGQHSQSGDPIALTRLPLSTEHDRAAPCASRTFNEATEAPLQAQAGATQQVDGLRYRLLTLNAGRADEAGGAQGLHIDTIDLLSDDPASRRLNTLLHARLPADGPDSVNRLYACRRNQRDIDGQQGISSERLSSVHLVKGRWLSAQADDSSNCGAPRTSSWVNHYTWDMQTGAPVDLMSWFKDVPATDNPENQAPGEYPQLLPTALRSLVLAKIPASSQQACPALSDPQSGFIPHLSEDGMWFSFPGSGQPPCVAEVQLPYADLQALLSEQGRQALKLAGGSHAHGSHQSASR